MDEKDKAVDPFELFQKYNMTSELDKVLISIDDPNDPDLIKYPNNPIKIDLSDRELIYVPNWIFKFTRRGSIQILDLSENNIRVIPPKIGQLTNLVKLHLVYNKLTSLPAELGQLTNLKTLYIFRNRLTSLPPEIGQLTNLEKLSVFHNRLTSLPPEIGQLTNLIELDISDNPNLELDSEL